MQAHDQAGFGPALIVEDEADSLEMVQGLLSHYGIPSAGAANAEEALTLLEQMQPSLMLIDLALPGMDGWRLVQQVRQRQGGQALPCIAITAYDKVGLAQQALEAGFDAYFAKPLDIAAFYQHLEGLLKG